MEALRRAVAGARLSPLELKVTEATSSDPWGPHGAVLSEIASRTHYAEDRRTILDLLWRRLGERPEQWRCVYKALSVVEFLLAQGSREVVEELCADKRRVAALDSFFFRDAEGKDQGLNVRMKSASLAALMGDPAKLAETRAKALANKNKYQGVGSGDSFRPAAQSSQPSRPPAVAQSSFDSDDDEPGRAERAAPRFRVQISAAPGGAADPFAIRPSPVPIQTQAAPPALPAKPASKPLPAVPGGGGFDPFPQSFPGSAPQRQPVAAAPSAALPPAMSLLDLGSSPPAPRPLPPAIVAAPPAAPRDDFFGLLSPAAPGPVDPFAVCGPLATLVPASPPPRAAPPPDPFALLASLPSTQAVASPPPVLDLL